MHRSSSSLKSDSSDKVRALAYAAGSPRISSWSSLDWDVQPESPSARQSALLSPKSPVLSPSLVLVGETPSHFSSFLPSPQSAASLGLPLLHPLIEPVNSGRVHFDISRRPNHAEFPHNTPLVRNSAFYPPTSRIFIITLGFPSWTFHVENAHGVTVQDIFAALHENLHLPVGRSEFTGLPAHTQSAATTGHMRRASADRREFERGVKRLDCLYPHAVFGGLRFVPGSGSGAWTLSLALCVPRGP